MPVIGTPVESVPSNPTSCDSQGIRTPAITKLYGTALPTKRRAVYANAGTVATLRLQLFDDNGNPVDITNCSSELATVEVRIRECISSQTSDIQVVDGEIEDSVEGIVSVAVPAIVYDNPGVYNCELGVVADDAVVFTNQFYLWINRGLFGNPLYPHAGPPTIDEIRLSLRDNAPEENLLLDDFEYDLAEMCHAAVYGVRYWNEAQPPIELCYTTTTYPARYMLTRYIVGHMLQVAAHRFRRNHLPYQAGGISIDDQNKFQVYDQMAMTLIQDYREWVKQKKVELNCYAAMTSTGSAYGSLAYHLLNTGI